MSAVSTAGAIRLLRLLHRDSVASVHTGTIGDSGSPVVVTVAHNRVDGSAREVFLDWAGRISQLSAHPHIASIAAVGLTADARPYVAVSATRSTLADILREGPLPPAGQIRALGVALADTLATIHSVGLIHGALQPATVLSGPGRKLLVAGFDATAPGLAHPLPPSAYTAPEHLDATQAGSVHASPAADVYSLATLLYAALGGRLPWVGPDRNMITDPLLRAAPVPDIPGVSITLTDALGAAMHAEPRNRPDAAGLSRLLSGADLSRRIAPGRRPSDVCDTLVPRDGPRPTPLPGGGADLAVRPGANRRNRRPSRLVKGAKLALAAVVVAAALGGAGVATYAATTGGHRMSCLSHDEIAEAVTSRHPDGKITDELCEAEYTAVLVDDKTGTVTSDSSAQESRLLRLVVHHDAEGIELVDGCEPDVPDALRHFLDCPGAA